MVRLSNFLIEGLWREKRDWAGGIVKGQRGKSQGKYGQKINSRRHDLGCKWVDVEVIRWPKSQGGNGRRGDVLGFYSLDAALFLGLWLYSEFPACDFPGDPPLGAGRRPPFQVHPTFGSTTSGEVRADI
jgi:hypothetical protein